MQAATQWWKTISTVLEEIDFQISEADHWLAYKQTQDVICLLIIYIGDIMIVGNKPMIEYLEMQIIQSKDWHNVWLGQPAIINSLEKKFSE